jgi:hypothetical protein
MPGEALLRVPYGWRVLFACLLLAGLAACAGLQEPREEEVPSVTAPSGEAAGQAVAAEELPEPEAENPDGGNAEAVEPALSGQPPSGGDTAPGAALPVPRPPAEAKKPAGKAKVTGEPAKAAAAAKAPAASPAKPPRRGRRGSANRAGGGP